MTTCIGGRCEYYEEFAKKFAKYFDVIGYIHGLEGGNKNNNINYIKSVVK